MQVTLSDPVIEVTGWTPDLDSLGSYTLNRRKKPEQVRAERQFLASRYREAGFRVDPVEHIPKNVISHMPEKPGTAYFLPGLWPRVKAHLDGAGIPYTVVDKRNMAIRPPLDMTAFRDVTFRANQDVAVALVAAADCGVIETATAFGKSFCIALICKALPTLNIVVTTSSTQVVNTLYGYLNETIPGQVGIMGGGRNRTEGKRVIVSTLKSLGCIPPENVHLVLVDECHQVGDNTYGEELMKFCWARRFGFSASPVRNDGSARMMEALLGPTILKMTYEEAADAGMVTPMKFLMLPCGSCPPAALQPGVPDFLLKRWAYWCNISRNNAIRRFVCDLKERFSGQILIMVSTLEHAIHLHRLLPWFKVASGAGDFELLQRKFNREKYPDVDLSAYRTSPKQLDIMRCAFAKGTLRHVIATKTWKAGVNFTHLRVLVRADGDTSEVEGIQIPGRLARLDEGKDCAYLVDVMDTFSQWAMRRARAREKLYRQQKWEPVTYQELIDDLGRGPSGDGKEPAG